MTTATEHAIAGLKTIAAGIEQSLVDLHKLADLDPAREGVDALRIGLAQRIRLAVTLLETPEPDDGVASLCAYTTGHGTTADDRGAANEVYVDLRLSDGRTVAFACADVASIRQLAADLIDSAAGVEAHNAGRPCAHSS